MAVKTWDRAIGVVGAEQKALEFARKDGQHPRDRDRGQCRRPHRSDGSVLQNDRHAGHQALATSRRPQRAGEEHVDPLHRNAVRPPRRPLEQVQRTDVG